MRVLIIAFLILNSAFCMSQRAEFSVDKAVFTFPDTEEGPVISHEFVITNTGDAPLVISDYKVSCPCTKAFFSKEPIQPGQTAVIEVTFETKGKYYEQDRTVLLFTNTKKGTDKLRFKVYVIPEGEE